MDLNEIKEGSEVNIKNHNLQANSFTVVKVEEDNTVTLKARDYKVEGVKPELLEPVK